jgi:hypothetical protein
LGFQYKQVVNVNCFPDYVSILDNDQSGEGELPNFEVEKGRFPGKTVCFPENRFILPGNWPTSRETRSLLSVKGTFPGGIRSFFRETGQIPRKQDHSSGKQEYIPENSISFPEKQFNSRRIFLFSGKLGYFPENSISFPGKRAVASWNYPFSVGNWFISRETALFFRETSLFPGEQYHISGKTIRFQLVLN